MWKLLSVIIFSCIIYSAIQDVGTQKDCSIPTYGSELPILVGVVLLFSWLFGYLSCMEDR